MLTGNWWVCSACTSGRNQTVAKIAYVFFSQFSPECSIVQCHLRHQSTEILNSPQNSLRQCQTLLAYLAFHLQRFSNQGSSAKTVDALQNVLLPGRSQHSMAPMAQQMGWMDYVIRCHGNLYKRSKGYIKIHIARIDDIPPRWVYNSAKTIFSPGHIWLSVHWYQWVTSQNEPLWFRRACPWAHHCKISVILLCPGRGSNTPEFTDVYSN